eukprot:scaffold1439_cov404-Prasinococcus_capsulatus_cf.AAC.23
MPRPRGLGAPGIGTTTRVGGDGRDPVGRADAWRCADAHHPRAWLPRSNCALPARPSRASPPGVVRRTHHRTSHARASPASASEA